MNYIFNQEQSNDKQFVTNDLFKNLNKNLIITKEKIDEYPKLWEKVKKMIHEYEYVYTSSYYKKNITTIIPISRSYFKIKEIIHDYDIQIKNKNIVCLAEAPGGFIQCILKTYENSKIHGITLVSEDKKIPYWNKSLFNSKNIQFHTGVKGNGDLYDLTNILSFIKSIGKNSCSFITGDGGIDYSNDYNHQELNSLKLIYGEIFMALNLQSNEGTFVCKIFDIFLKETISLLYILYLSYDELIIHKPCMSRLSNSEKYIICKGFKGYNQSLVNLMMHHFEKNDLTIEIPTSFIEEIYNFNDLYISEQINHIQNGINIIKNKYITDKPSQKQIKKSIQWCKKYKLPINQECFYL